jgi:glycolate oxidase FAD binding subunit
MSTANTVARLVEIVGESNFVASPPELAAYEIDGQRPSVVVRPGSAGEVAEVIKFARSEKLAVIPTGARTKTQIGLPPRKYDLAVDVTRLDHVLAYDPDDLTLSVEAEIPLRKLSDALRERGQFLPLAVPFFDRATVGGTIASAVDSPLRQFYGTARDYILGIEFVTGDGTPAKSGGRVVKNVTGYDLHKLMIGALGTLGVMTRINFRTFPLPVDSRAFIANFNGPDHALDLRARVTQAPLAPLTLEILSPHVADLFYGTAAAQIEPKPFAPGVMTNTSWAFTAGFAGTERVLDRCEQELRRMAEQAGATAISVLGREQIPGAFGRKREFVPIALKSSPAATIIKASVLPGRMKEILAEVGAGAARNALRYAALARGVGVIYVALLPDSNGDEARQQVVRVAERTQAACVRAQGSAVVPWCPTGWKTSLQIWGADRTDLSQMRKLKAVFDPQATLSPGRFVGGL